MRPNTLDAPYDAENQLEVLALRVLAAIGSVKVLRSGSRILPQIAGGAVLLLLGAYLWSSQFATSASLSSTPYRILKWKPTEIGDGGANGGLRIVVFGGGDIATPSRASWQFGGPSAGWTEVLCQQLKCALYHSFVPLTDNDEGAIVSNSLFRAALTRTSPGDDNNTIAGLDYSWLAESYPVPPHQDLLHQIDAFLTSPRPHHPPSETLWIFNLGFWDIWSLAALPRKLAAHIIETQAQQIFSHIELLYQEAHRDESVAFSDYYADMDSATKHAAATATKTTGFRRAPFRVFIPRPFDISLTPGFLTSRLAPPPPHTKPEQLRNAAFLARHWDKTMQDMIREWVHLPDPETEEVSDDGGDDLSRIEDAELLISKRAATINRPPARREAITYDVSGYVRELIVERQLRDADIVDRDGLGSKAAVDGYEEVWEPCIQRGEKVFDRSGGGNKTGTAGTGDSGGWSVCEEPDKHLFWTAFTVNRQAIFEIGRRAAEHIKRHEEVEAEWRVKAQQPLSSLHRESDGWL